MSIHNEYVYDDLFEWLTVKQNNLKILNIRVRLKEIA